MPKAVTQYDLLISCPGDIVDELQVIDNVVNDFNNRFTDFCGISIRTKHWKKNSFPQSGGKPQALLNEQFVKDCDAAVALFWTRFGTQTDEYGSGTEEEIEIMLKDKKQVFLYFSDIPQNPSKIDADERSRIEVFREKYKDKGLYRVYSSTDEFEKMFSAHLAQYFFGANAIQKMQDERMPKLLIRGIDENETVSECVAVIPFKLNSSQSMENYIDKIRNMYNDINSMHVGRFNDNAPFFNRPEEVSEEEKTFINQIAETFGIIMEDDFYELGGLTENTLQSALGGRVLEGSKDEKRKYDLISRLYETAHNCLRWSAIERAYSDLYCIKLAVENSGTAIDEDVEIELSFGADELLTIQEFPKLSDEAALRYLLDECSIEEMISIPSTQQYKEYSRSVTLSAPVGYSAPSYSMGFFSNRDLQEDYYEALVNAYDYEIFPGDKTVLKVNFDYIKHHTIVAFPTVVFVKKIPSEIGYRITSKKTADVVSGKIEVESRVK